MPIMCTVRGLALLPQGGPNAEATLNIERHGEAAGYDDETFPTETVTDATGAFSFTVPQGARVRFHSTDAPAFEGYQFTAPNSKDFDLGAIGFGFEEGS